MSVNSPPALPTERFPEACLERATPNGFYWKGFIPLGTEMRSQILAFADLYTDLATASPYLGEVMRLEDSEVNRKRNFCKAHYNDPSSIRHIKDGETLYVIKNTKAHGPEFARKSAILEQGKLSKYMRDWLGGTAMSAFWHEDFDDFLPLLPNSPTTNEEFSTVMRALRRERELAAPDDGRADLSFDSE